MLWMLSQERVETRYDVIIFPIMMFLWLVNVEENS